ncbi:MAG: ATP-dependent zinc metalloprotease FtsH [Cyanobacteria bacterium]|nr:ATP-dependent zinc metalloprotease FtsH [Cyanobacteriota bacterium]
MLMSWGVILWWSVLIFIVFVVSRIEPNDLPYSKFLQLVSEQKVSDVVVRGRELRGLMLDDSAKPLASSRQGHGQGTSTKLPFRTTIVDPELVKLLGERNVQFRAEPESNWLSRLASFAVPILFFVFFILMMAGRDVASGKGGLLSVGRSRARVYMEEQIKVTFDDVAGVDEAKEELQEIVTFLREPERYKRLGGKLPKGILLVGPPGTGKTLLARAVAGEASVPFFCISGSEFVELFVGVGAARVRDLFEQAKQKAPCIIFIDELDALGRARGAGPVTGGHDEKEQTLNQLLAELDGFDSGHGVVLLAATNRPEILDPALLRAGRFDRQVLVDRPDKTGRLEVLKIHLKSVILSPSVDPSEIAAMTPGFTGADLANLVNEATLLAARRNAQSVESVDFTEALERIVAGLEKKNRLLNEHERRIVSFHEMGHALVSLSLSNMEPIQKISIIPRGISALGYTLQKPTEDRYLMSKEELESKMTVLMGGRAAEALVFGSISTGAADDFVKATEIARNMVTRFGMAPSLGMVSYEQDATSYLSGNGHHQSFTARISEETARAIDVAVREMLKSAYQRAESLLSSKIELLKRGAELLLNKEILSHDELLLIVSEYEEGFRSPSNGLSDKEASDLVATSMMTNLEGESI